MYDGTAVAEVTTTDAVAQCRHCGKRPGVRARGLCRVCHGSPRLRGLYTSRKPRREYATPCRGCGERKRIYTRRLGLCRACYDVRGEHPGREDGLGTAPGHRPCKATRALPGSLRKMAVLRGRLRRGEELWHSRDGRRGEE